MNAPTQQRPEGQEGSFPIQFKILLAIIVGGVTFLLLQAIGVF